MGHVSGRKLEKETPLKGRVLAVKLEAWNFLTRHAVGVSLILIALLAFLVYSNTFSVPFIFDDIFNILDNPKIRQLWGSLDYNKYHNRQQNQFHNKFHTSLFGAPF